MDNNLPLVERIRSRFTAPKLSHSLDDIADYYKTPIGKAMLSGQKRMVGNALSNLFGYHLMELSPLTDSSFSKRSRVNHCFTVRPFLRDSDLQSAGCVEKDKLSSNQGNANSRRDLSGAPSSSASDLSSLKSEHCHGVSHDSTETKLTQHGVRVSVMASDPMELPFADESIDVCILHHVLEFSENPHQVLKEAARVTIARGHIVIVGFNPISLLGLFKPVFQPFSQSAIWKRRSLRVSRLYDWLEFLDFSRVNTSYAAHNLPLNNEKYLRSTRGMEKLFRRKGWPLGSIYCIVACKDKLSLTPLKPEWGNTAMAGLAKKQVIRSSLNEGGVNSYPKKIAQTSGILPFRKNINKNR